MADGDYQTGFAADFHPPLEKKHECPVCMFALRDPIQTACGHRFCTACIKQVLRKQRPRCPLDNEQLNQDEIFPDVFCKREVLSLHVWCSNKAKGCAWLGALNTLENHERSCDFTVIRCSNEGCQVTVLFRDLAHHQEHDCKFQTVLCAICGSAIVFSQQRDHFSRFCPDIEIECENGCGTKQKRREMPEHHCPCGQKMTCQYVAVGCYFKGNSIEMKQHQAQELQNHLALLLSQLMRCITGEANMSQQQQQLDSGHEAIPAVANCAELGLGRASSSTGIDIVDMQKNIADLKAQMEYLMNLLSDANQQLLERDRIIQEQNQQIEEMRNVVRQLEESLQQLSSQVSSCRQKVVTNTSRISRFEQKHNTSQGQVAAMEYQPLAVEKRSAVTTKPSATLPSSEHKQRETLSNFLCGINAALATELNQDVEAKQHSRLTGESALSSMKQQQIHTERSLSAKDDAVAEVDVRLLSVKSIEQQHIASQGEIAAMEHRQVAIEKKAVKDTTMSLAVKDSAMAEHEVRLLSLEMMSQDGVLRWKITEFSRRRTEAVAGKRLSIYSPPFYTSRCGYKMCARIYLNGDGMGKGSHLSLFFVIMKGEYDALLPWPFQQRVTFTVLDQDHRCHISDTFQPDPASTSFQCPVNDMNVASGCPLFVPLEALETRGYVKDDTMFIRVAVDIKGLVHP